MTSLRVRLYAVAELLALGFHASITAVYMAITADPWYKIFASPFLVIWYIVTSIKAVMQYNKADKSMDLNNHKYNTPANASRGPCPFLNTIANHGYIPPSGRDITLPQLMIAMKKTLNLGPMFSFAVSSTALAFHGHQHPVTFERCLTLSDLGGRGGHVFIEHDASLTRRDVDLGDNTHLDQEMYQNLLSIADGKSDITLDQLVEYRKKVEAASAKRNPHFTWSFLQRFGSYQEAIFLPVCFGNGKDSVSVATVKSIFGEERFPDDFKPSKTPLEFGDISAARFKMMEQANQISFNGQVMYGIIKPWMDLLSAKKHKE